MLTCVFGNPICAVALLCALCSVHSAAWSSTKTDSWVKPPPPRCLKIPDSEKRGVPREDIYEVVNSKFGTAVYDLEDELAKQYTEYGGTEYLLGAWYKLPEGKKPYLIRALYGKAKGRFDAWWCGEDLVISHSTLVSSDAIAEENKTALIINLEKAPNTVYVEMEI